MASTQSSSLGGLPLTPLELARLTKAAELFDIQVSTQASGRVAFQVLEKEGLRQFEVDEKFAPVRLIAELCSKTVRWIYYHPGQHCSLTISELTDKKLERIGELYRRWKLNGFPE